MNEYWKDLLRHLESYPITVQRVRIDGRRWAHVLGASTTSAEEIALPHRIQLDEHSGLIVRGWDGLNAAQQAEIMMLIAAVCQPR